MSGTAAERGRVCVRVVLDELLRGYGQIFFCGTRPGGLLVLAATLVVPAVGACGLLGALAAWTVARALGVREDLARCGLPACNGALSGLAVATFVPAPILPWPWTDFPAGAATPLSTFVAAAALALCGGALAAFFLHGLAWLLDRLELPALSLPFVLATWTLLLLVARGKVGATLASTVAPREAVLAWLAVPHADFAGVLRVLAATVLSTHALAGAVCLLAACTLSVRHGLLVLGGAVLGLLASTIAPSGDAWLTGVNVMIAFVALAGVFVPLRRGGLGAGLVASALALLVVGIMARPLERGGLPLLVAPFNVAAISVLAVLRHRTDRTANGAATVAPGGPPMRLPFCGMWQVSQGPHGSLTHQGEGAHAWDFVVIDERGSTHADLGLYTTDYHAFGKPVLAPADGVVAVVVDGIDDNEPLEENRLENWGNHVVIDHGHDVYSELSHFQKHSICVAVGNPVRAGDVLGRCGSSGRSCEPHIHFQVQVAPYAGAPSVPARFAPFVVDGQGRGVPPRLAADGAPREGEVVGNP